MNRPGPARVVVAEDSSTARELVVEVLSRDPGLSVVGEARDGREALALVGRLRPDVVVMDIHMPGLDGFEATRRIMTDCPTPIVIVTESGDAADVKLSLDALRAGALVLLPKPARPLTPGFDALCARFVETVKSMSKVKVVRRWPERAARAELIGDGSARGGVEVVAIAASTGGPAALGQVLSRLPADLPAPILVVQHIAEGFVPGLASWLNALSPLPVKVAEPGEPVEPGRVYLAPDGAHLGLNGRLSIRLSNEPPLGGFRPSGSFLFESVARASGRAALGVILTGMGRDGVEGLRVLRESGGRVIAQDEASSVVYGMPGAAVEEGLADHVLPLEAIPGRIVGLLRGRSP